jgi:hypothetical protein
MHAVMPSVRFCSAKSAVQQIQPESDTETLLGTLGITTTFQYQLKVGIEMVVRPYMHAVMPSVRFYSAKSAVQQIQPRI